MATFALTLYYISYSHLKWAVVLYALFIYGIQCAKLMKSTEMPWIPEHEMECPLKYCEKLDIDGTCIIYIPSSMDEFIIDIEGILYLYRMSFMCYII